MITAFPLEVCVSSNHPDAGAADTIDDASAALLLTPTVCGCTINTDNRLVTNTTVSKELLLCHLHYGFTLDDIKELIVSGFKSAFLPYREKADLLSRVTKELEQFVEPGAESRPTETPRHYGEQRGVRIAEDTRAAPAGGGRRSGARDVAHRRELTGDVPPWRTGQG